MSDATADRRAESRTFWMAGRRIPARTAMRAMTTRSSSRVKARRGAGAAMGWPSAGDGGTHRGQSLTAPGRGRNRPDSDAAIAVWAKIDPVVGDLTGRAVREGVPDRVPGAGG